MLNTAHGVRTRDGTVCYRLLVTIWNSPSKCINRRVSLMNIELELASSQGLTKMLVNDLDLLFDLLKVNVHMKLDFEASNPLAPI